MRALRVSWMLWHVSMLTKIEEKKFQLNCPNKYHTTIFFVSIFKISMPQVMAALCARVDWCTCCVCGLPLFALISSMKCKKKLNSIRNSAPKGMISCAFSAIPTKLILEKIYFSKISTDKNKLKMRKRHKIDSLLLRGLCCCCHASINHAACRAHVADTLHEM